MLLLTCSQWKTNQAFVPRPISKPSNLLHPRWCRAMALAHESSTNSPCFPNFRSKFGSSSGVQHSLRHIILTSIPPNCLSQAIRGVLSLSILTTKAELRHCELTVLFTSNDSWITPLRSDWSIWAQVEIRCCSSPQCTLSAPTCSEILQPS
jgi:hypothetical protein